MKNFYYFHFWLEPIDFDFDFRVQFISSVVVATCTRFL